MDGNRYADADFKEMVQDAAEDLRADGIRRPTAVDVKRYIKMIHGLKLSPARL
jgi:hypothetical protein